MVRTMVNPPDIYTGAHFTIRYGDCVQQIPDYIVYDDGQGNEVSIPFGFNAALYMLQNNLMLDMSHLTRFLGAWTEIEKRLRLRDWRKELGAETPDDWIVLCAQKIAEVAEKYEPVLAMEATAGFDVSNPSKESRTIQYGHVINGQVQDTPYGQLQAASDYVSGQTREEHSGQDVIDERTGLDADILSGFRQRWEATINIIVEEFDELFIRITGGEFIA